MLAHAEARRQVRFLSVLPSTVFLRQGFLPNFLVWLDWYTNKSWDPLVPTSLGPGFLMWDSTLASQRVCWGSNSSSHIFTSTALCQWCHLLDPTPTDLYKEHTDYLPTYTRMGHILCNIYQVIDISLRF